MDIGHSSLFKCVTSIVLDDGTQVPLTYAHLHHYHYIDFVLPVQWDLLDILPCSITGRGGVLCLTLVTEDLFDRLNNTLSCL